MYELWYDYIKLEHQDKTKPCYTVTDSFIMCIKDFYKDMANYVRKWFDTCNYDESDKIPLSINCFFF